MARTSRRSTGKASDELTHVTTPKLAALMGVSLSAVRSWKEIASFPRPNKQGEWCVRDCMIWYLSNKAPRPIQEEMHSKLSSVLGVKVEAGTSAEQPTTKAARDNAVDEQFRLLNLKTAQAKYEREFGDLVRIRDVERILRTFMRRVREVLESVQRLTGHPVGPGMEKAIEATMREIQQIKNGGGHDRGE